MLVRVSHTDAESVGTAFDENQNLITRHLEYEDWSEFMVIWRRERLELYEDYASRCQLSSHAHQLKSCAPESSRQGVGYETQTPFVRRPPWQSQNEAISLLVCGHDILLCLPAYPRSKRLQGSSTIPLR